MPCTQVAIWDTFVADMRRKVSVTAGLIGTCLLAVGQTWQGNHDESKVRPYTLPDVLTLLNGKKVTTAEQWRKE